LAFAQASSFADVPVMIFSQILSILLPGAHPGANLFADVSAITVFVNFLVAFSGSTAPIAAPLLPLHRCTCIAPLQPCIAPLQTPIALLLPLHHRIHCTHHCTVLETMLQAILAQAKATGG